jgi:hypothetical protein
MSLRYLGLKVFYYLLHLHSHIPWLSADLPHREHVTLPPRMRFLYFS